jgi:nitronate monooxygenase
MPRTSLCNLLGIEQPILNAGISAGAGPELAAAVSNAGGLGVVAVSGLPPEVVLERIRRTRELTDRPFGINVIIDEHGTAETAESLMERCRTVIDEGVALLILFAGDPAPYVEPAHAAGVKVAVQVGSPAEARQAADAGVDFVIAQGIEAGGHVVARTGLLVNLPRIVDAVAPLPVVASGGIADGRGVAAALALGAVGVSIGTRFLASEEAFVHEEYKRRVVEAGDESTVYTEDLFDVFWRDVPHRTLRGPVYDEWDAAGRPASGARPHEGEPIGTSRSPFREVEIPRYASYMLTPWFEGDLELVPMWAGESVALVDGILPAAEIVRRLAEDADAALAGVGRAAAR